MRISLTSSFTTAISTVDVLLGALLLGIFIGGAAADVFKMLFFMVVLLDDITTGEVCFGEVMVAMVSVVVVTAGNVVVTRIGIVDVGLLTSFTGVELLPTLARVVWGTCCTVVMTTDLVLFTVEVLTLC